MPAHATADGSARRWPPAPPYIMIFTVLAVLCAGGAVAVALTVRPEGSDRTSPVGTALGVVAPTTAPGAESGEAAAIGAGAAEAGGQTPARPAAGTSGNAATPATPRSRSAKAGAPSQAVGGSGSGRAGVDRYFPSGTPVSQLRAKAEKLSKREVKQIIASQVDEHWPAIKARLGLDTERQAVAFFLGMASRESTLNAALETGSGPSHSYGALQAAETAYANANPSYTPERDVPEVTQYDFTPQNFYDPGIAVHSGVRHLLHFANQARAAGFGGQDLLRHALIGYNTGHVQTSDSGLLQSYADEIGALAGWYLSEGHLSDEAFTWTGAPDVDRSDPWAWTR